jgi:hypothetical protein
MSNLMKCRVLKTVRVADGGNPYGREIQKDTDDQVPAELYAGLKDAGYITDVVSTKAKAPKGSTSPLAKLKREELEALAAEKSVDISAAKADEEIVAILEAAGVSPSA